MRLPVNPVTMMIAGFATTLAMACNPDAAGPIQNTSALGTLDVKVETSGANIDTTGYYINAVAPSDSYSPTAWILVAANGSASMSLPPNTYRISFTGVAENCTLMGGVENPLRITLESGARMSLRILFECG
jgi:hypothetical protein